MAPTRGMSTGAKIGIAVSGLVGLGVVLVVVVALLGTSVEQPPVVPLTDASPASFVRFEDPAGDFALDLHPAWISLSLRGDVTGVGAAAAPDDPGKAAAIDAFVSTAPRQVVFAAVDGDRLGKGAFVANINVIPVPRDGATIEEIELEIPHSVEAFGAGDAHVERVATSEGAGLRMTYRYLGGGPASGAEGVQYYVFDVDTVWVLTMTSQEMAADRSDFEASASSFTLG